MSCLQPSQLTLTTPEVRERVASSIRTFTLRMLARGWTQMPFSAFVSHVADAFALQGGEPHAPKRTVCAVVELLLDPRVSWGLVDGSRSDDGELQAFANDGGYEATPIDVVYVADLDPRTRVELLLVGDSVVTQVVYAGV